MTELVLGIRLTADGSGLVGALRVSKAELDKLTNAHGTAARETRRLNDESGGLANTLNSRLKSAVLGMAAAFGTYRAAQYIKDTANLAARYETLGVVMEVVGRNAGYSQPQMAAFADELQKTGISMLESRQTLVQMAQAQINLSKSTELARIAQHAAVIGNINSSEAFQRMIHGIQSGQTEILRTIGINVSFEQSYGKLAAQLGKNTTELTEVEKTQARANAVLESGGITAGIYEKSMTTANKQLGSMARLHEDLRIKLGSVFNESYTRLIFSMSDAFKAANEKLDELTESGQLQAWGTTLANTLSAIGNAFVPAFEIAVAYYTLFKGVPLIMMAASAAKAFLTRQVLLLQLAQATGVGTMAYFNTTLFGTSVAANLASGALTKLRLAGGLLLSAFTGWQIGAWLRENFVEARIAGLAFVGALMKGWEHLKYGASVAWAGIKSSWDTAVTSMKSTFADFVDRAAAALARIPGFGGASLTLSSYATSLRSAAGGVETFAAAKARLAGEHEREINAIDENITSLVAYELGLNNTAKATAKLTPATPADKPIHETKATREARLQALLSGFEDELRITQAHDRTMQAALEAANGNNLFSISDYYKQRGDMVTAGLRTEMASIGKQIAAMQEFKAESASDEINKHAKINSLIAQRTVLQEQINETAVKGYSDSDKAYKALGAQLVSLNTQYLVMKNRLEEAAAGTFDLANEQLKSTLQQEKNYTALNQLEELRARAIEDAATDWESGTRRAFRNYANEATNAAKQVENALTRSMQAGEDAFIKLATTGKASISDLLTTVAEEVVRYYYRTQIAGPIAQGLAGFNWAGLFGGGGSTARTFTTPDGLTGNYPLQHSGGIAGAEASGMRAVPVDVFRSAPRLHSGGLAGDEVPTILRRREGVFTEGQMRALAPVGAGGPQNIRVEIVNQGQPQEVVSARPSFDVDGMVVQIVTRDVRGNGPITRALAGTYNLSRTGG